MISTLLIREILAVEHRWCQPLLTCQVHRALFYQFHSKSELIICREYEAESAMNSAQIAMCFGGPVGMLVAAIKEQIDLGGKVDVRNIPPSLQ